MTPAMVARLRGRRTRGPMMALGVLLVALAAIACGGGAAAPTGTGTSAPEAADAGEQRLWIKHGEEMQPFANGDEVAVGAMSAEIFVSPYPPGRTANIDFYLTSAGEPVEGANITLQYDMTVMEHGPFQLLAVPTGRGHYLAAVDFAMDGVFWLNVSLDIANDESIINLLVRAAR